MKLKDLIPYLTTDNQVEKLIEVKKLNVESEAIIIAMETKVALDAEIHFFGIEETEGNLKFSIDDVKYEELFPLFYAQELVEDYCEKGYDHLETAKMLLKYWENDA